MDQIESSLREETNLKFILPQSGASTEPSKSWRTWRNAFLLETNCALRRNRETSANGTSIADTKRRQITPPCLALSTHFGGPRSDILV